MAATMRPLLLNLVSTLLLILTLTCQVVAPKPEGLTLELIHRHSPKSPFYKPNLTQEERLQSLVNQSIAHVQHLSNPTLLASASTYDPETVRIIMNPAQQITLYNVKLALGTSPQFPKSYNLLMDTGSDLTWIQCEKCKPNRCFASTDVPFPCSKSTSYHPLPCKAHPLCENSCNDQNQCTFGRRYADSSQVTGILATETFTFGSSTSSSESVQGLVFGCTTDSNQISFAGQSNTLSGVLGLSFGPKSFVTQIGTNQTQGRFSYCLTRNPSTTSSFISFGADVTQRKGLSVTSLIRNYQAGYVFYYVFLVGITLNGNKLNIPPSVFSLDRRGGGGTVIDSGAAFSHITRPAHDILVTALAGQFSSLVRSGVLEKVTLAGKPLELCYEIMRPSGFTGYPVIGFVFQNDVKMSLDAEAAFVKGKSSVGNVYFCLGMVPENVGRPSVIGTFQQTNQRFIYDTKKYRLFFGPENCSS